MYGKYVFFFNDTDSLANNLIDCYFNGFGLFDTLDLYKSVTKKEVEAVIREKFNEKGCCLSVIK